MNLVLWNILLMHLKEELFMLITGMCYLKDIFGYVYHSKLADSGFSSNILLVVKVQVVAMLQIS